jgi:hypothetical protein
MHHPKERHVNIDNETTTCAPDAQEKLRKKNYEVREISHAQAQEIVIKNHYLHRRAPCSFSWGLFLAGTLCGVVMYGTPSSAPLRMGIAGKEQASNVIELTRLWVDDSVPNNGESFLIGYTLKKVNKEIVVSFADTSQGHLGVVYQATNWLYTGLSAKRTSWTVEGLEGVHCQTIADKYTSAELKAKYGDKFTLVPRPRKHRYIYFNCKGKRREELLKSLLYKVQPYPKKT